MTYRNSWLNRAISTVYFVLKKYSLQIVALLALLVDNPIENPFVRTMILINASNVYDWMVIKYYEKELTEDNIVDLAFKVTDSITVDLLYSDGFKIMIFLTVFVHYKKLLISSK